MMSELIVYIPTPSRKFSKGKRAGKIDTMARVVSEANTREHWRVKHKRGLMQKILVKHALYRKPKPSLPVTVTFTRCGKKLLDDDNLANGFKAARDFTSNWIGVDDGATDKIRFVYKQKLQKEYGFYIKLKGEK